MYLDIEVNSQSRPEEENQVVLWQISHWNQNEKKMGRPVDFSFL